mmetsp:Transcript_32629/g.86203  ORF Transcript_32629/g.86203 Transcript_32629/m.86203 type:complete len:229 (-) Transcript_32629:134-820(-)
MGITRGGSVASLSDGSRSMLWPSWLIGASLVGRRCGGAIGPGPKSWPDMAALISEVGIAYCLPSPQLLAMRSPPDGDDRIRSLPLPLMPMPPPMLPPRSAPPMPPPMPPRIDRDGGVPPILIRSPIRSGMPPPMPPMLPPMLPPIPPMLPPMRSGMPPVLCRHGDGPPPVGNPPMSSIPGGATPCDASMRAVLTREPMPWLPFCPKRFWSRLDVSIRRTRSLRHESPR